MKPRTLLIDIETFPHIGFFWGGMYEQNIIKLIERGYILCYSYKWFNEKKIKFVRVKGRDYKRFLKTIWNLLNKADIVIGQNSDNFDIRHINAELIINGFKPPSPYKTIDTYKISKKFKLPSHKLDDMAFLFGFGRKKPHHGFKTWEGCKANDPKAWREMREYNIHDVWLLDKVYRVFQGWANPPKFYHKDLSCPIPTCQSKHFQSRGVQTNASGKKYHKFQCQDCGKWFSIIIK